MPSAVISHSVPLGRGGAVPLILKLVCELTRMRMALVARVADERWTVYAVHDRMNYGLAVGDRLDMGSALTSDPYDAAPTSATKVAITRRLPRKHSTSLPAPVGSCLSVPIRRPDGQLFGTLCAIDRSPIAFKQDLNVSLVLLAELLEQLLAADNERQEREDRLKLESKTSRSREEFIAVLAHDLRNPLSGIIGSVNFLEILEPGPDRDEMFRIIRNSAQQISRLVDDVLDFARGRLGAGIPLERRCMVDLTVLASNAIDELCAAHPGRSVHLRQSGPALASVDEVRLRQLLSNLLGNAIQHSPPEEPVTIKLDSIGKKVRIDITNGGPPLPITDEADLFSPFASQPNRTPRSGLGLGLFIASEIARAHGGTIKARSDQRGTTFTTLIPQSCDDQ